MVTPCTLCGACCVTYRVCFGREELDESPGGVVPGKLVLAVSRRRVCMSGTQLRTPRCISLQGSVGQRVSCAIYDRRPSPCQAFGRGDMCCADARRAHGLAPLPGSYDACLLA